MSKIIIGSNTYGEYHRQNVATDSWIYLSKIRNVEVVDVQFKDEEKEFATHYAIPTLFDLERSSLDIVAGSKKLPFISDILNSIYQEAKKRGANHFIYTNSDVIINENLIKYISAENPTAVACSRLDIQHVKDFQQILDKKVTPVRYEIAGFDTFVFKTEWYENNSHLFADYLMGMPWWDQVYAAIMKIYGNNDPLGNNFPPYCFHIHHDTTWQNDKSLEREYNGDLCENSEFDRLLFKVFDNYLSSVLTKRQPYGSFMTPVNNEVDIEKKFWQSFIF
jgi:hypothetical protein